MILYPSLRLKPSHRLTLGVLLLSILANPLAKASVTPQALEAEVAARIERVAEFKTIRIAAQELGIHAWIFGGTASAFGHYVRWDLERQAGDLRYNAARFDYHYSNIFRSSQDLDVVIDATEEQRKQFEKFLQDRFPYVQGSKNKWEVRLLKQSSGDKDSLLDNRDYLEQNTDSNSTGMIELSVPSQGESAVRDLRNWNSPNSDFLEDLSTGTIHYYYSATHSTTARAMAGKNPEILSAIRYMTKVVQYDLKTSKTDLDLVRKIVSRYDPTAKQDSYVTHWIEKNGPKLLQNAIDVERAWNLVDKVGLRTKFLTSSSVKSYKDEEHSLSWWFSKEPLRSYPIGQGPGPKGLYRDVPSGKTARELGLTVLSHGTSNFKAFESITMSRMGLPNFFISRDKTEDEAAAYGDGVYFAPGREGAGKSNFTIRVAIDPRAVEGKDFVIVNGGNFVVALNRTVFTIVPESLSVDLVEWFRMLSHGNQFSNADQGIVQGIRSRVEKDATRLTDAQDLEISQILRDSMEKKDQSKLVIREWSQLKLNLKHFQLTPHEEFMLSLQVIDASKEASRMKAAIKTFTAKPQGQSQWIVFQEAVEKTVEPEIRMRAYQAWLASPTFSKTNTPQDLFEMLLNTSEVPDYNEKGFKALWVKAMNERLAKPLSSDVIDGLRRLLKTKIPKSENSSIFFSCIAETELPEKVFKIDGWIELAGRGRLKASEYGKTIESILARSDVASTLAERKRAQEIAIAFAEKKDGKLTPAFFNLWVNLPISAQETDLVAKTAARSLTGEQVGKFLDSHPGTQLLNTVIEQTDRLTLGKLFKAWTARIRYDNSGFFAEAINEHSELILRKIVEHNLTNFEILPTIVNNMRTTNHYTELAPFFQRWVGAAVSGKNIAMLSAVAHSYAFSEVQTLSREFKKLVDFILTDPVQYNGLITTLYEQVGSTTGIDITSQLVRLMRYAIETKQSPLLAKMVNHWTSSPDLFRVDTQLLDDLLTFYQETHDWNGLGSLIYQRRHFITASEFDLYLSIAEKNELKAAFDKLTWTFPQDPIQTLGNTEVRRRLASLITAAERHDEWLHHLRHVASNTFSAYDLKDVMPIESFMIFLDASFRNSNFSLAYGLLDGHLIGRPQDVHTHFKLAHREFIRRLFAIKGSSSKTETDFKDQMLVQIKMADDHKRPWFPEDLREDYLDLTAKNETRFNSRHPNVEKTATGMVARERAIPCKNLLKNASTP